MNEKCDSVDIRYTESGMERADQNNTADASKRRFLMTNTGLIVAGSLGGLGIATPVTPSFAGSDWSFERFHSRPENTSWRILDQHDTGYVKSDWRPRSGANKSRLRMRSASDGKTAFEHNVRKREIVDPVRVDSRKIDVNFASFNRVLLRYHHWIDGYSYLPGKWIGLQIGRGWVGRNHVKKVRDGYGTDGGSATTMHPRLRDGNGIRLLATHKNQRSPYGINIGRGRELMPRGRWITVDIVIDKNKGHRLYCDGMLKAQKSGITPVRNWNACKAIWYRTRLMHGGTPRKLPALTNYKEYFGGYFVGVA